MWSTIKNILSESLFFRLYIVFAIAWFGLILGLGRDEFFLRINDGHHPALDATMPYITHIGDGFVALGLLVALFFWKIKYGVMAIISFVGSGAITQFLKKWVFDWPRPARYFDMSEGGFNLVDGVELHTTLSFPSGHSTSAFAVFCLMSLLLFKQKYLGFLFCFVAIVAAFSRCYLFQHFPEDVLVGSLIGTATSLLVYAWISSSSKSFGGNRGVLSLFQK